MTGPAKSLLACSYCAGKCLFAAGMADVPIACLEPEEVWILLTLSP